MFDVKGFRYAQSHQNDALGCAIALEVIRTSDKLNFVGKANKTGNYFRKLLNELQTKHTNNIVEVRSRGLMLAVEFYPKVDAGYIFNQLHAGGFVVGRKDNTLSTLILILLYFLA